MTFHPYQPVNLDFFNTANLRVTSVIEARCPSERIMETLRGDVVWTQWAPALKKVEWTSPKPYGQGSTRTVYLAGNQAVRELFFHWDENHRAAFYVVEGTLPGMQSFAEDYRIEPVNADVMRLTWTVAIELTGLQKYLAPVSAFFMKRVLQIWLDNYKVILEQGA